MVIGYDDLNANFLAPYGFENPEQSCLVLQEMAGHDVPDGVYERFLGVVMDILRDSADPDRAVANLGRWADAVGSRVSAYTVLTAHPAAAHILLTIFAASQFFADMLIRSPEYLEVLLDPAIRDRGRDFAAYQSELSRRLIVAPTPQAKRDALRRFKSPEILRIGARDLLGYATLSETVREISGFAEACVVGSLEICAPARSAESLSFAVLALGKLGGRELNYASDIDLIFIHGDSEDAQAAIEIAKDLQQTLSQTTGSGFVFRVDLRLRPEGRFGPVSRSLASCQAYYESWAEPWERQALLKVRCIAGDRTLGAAFVDMADAYVYRVHVDEGFVASIQANKQRMDEKVAREGGALTNVKEGIGGIRDIEFSVQLLQLIAGGRNPDLRLGNTLELLQRLAHHGLISSREHDVLAENYIFLRAVEHRLQILDERPVRTLPTSPRELEKFGRRLGYSGSAAFMVDYRRRTGQVRSLFESIFYGNSPANGAPATPDLPRWATSPEDGEAQSELKEVLQAHGFQKVEITATAVIRGLIGSEYGQVAPDAREALIALLPTLLASTDADPDAAVQGILALGDAVPSRAALFRMLCDSPHFVRRLCCLAAGSSHLWQVLLAHLEFFDLLADDEEMDRPPTRTPPEDARSLAAGLRRARLKTGARDLWGIIATPQVLAEVSATADWTLQNALTAVIRKRDFSGRFAVIGLGKLGGLELGYGSDLDIIFVADDGPLEEATHVAEDMLRFLSHDIAKFGTTYEVDPRLRPDGGKGALVLDMQSYRRYYTKSAATWERQALLKSRLAAGDSTLGAQFLQMAEVVVYGQPWSDDDLDAIRHMKRRLETERLKNPFDLKLGHGGLSDIEWTTQFLQLKFGARRKRVRAAGTLEALRRLRDEALITQLDWQTLSDCYCALSHLRNRLYLKNGVAVNTPKTIPEDLVAQMYRVRDIVDHRFYAEAK